MADNTTYTPGAGATIAADDVGGALVQRIKPQWGPDGSATDPDHAVGKGLPIQTAPISHAHLVTAANTNPTVVKGSAGKLRSVHVFNVADYPIYVKFHDSASSPTAGVGVVMTVGVQAGRERDFRLPGARSFTTGIAMTVVKGMADSDNTAVAANDAHIEVAYE